MNKKPTIFAEKIFFMFQKSSFVLIPFVDHLKGLTPSWNFGKIYSSKISKRLICDRYPHLKDYVVRKLLAMIHID